MRVIILAADVGLPDQNQPIPKCLLKLKESTILEYQISKLREFGLNEIVTVVGGEGDCWCESVYEKIKSISPRMVINKKNTITKNGFSFYIGTDCIGSESVLVIDGDLVFTEGMIRELINTKYENVLISRPALSISEEGGKIVLSDGKMTKAGIEMDIEDFPWQIYSGVAKFGEKAIKAIRSHIAKKPNVYLLDAVGEICKSHPFYAISSIQKEESKRKSVIGGSYANVEIKKIIRKEAKGLGKQKLIDEINWLKRLPPDIGWHFPQIKDYGISEEIVYLEQPFYELPSLRDLLFNQAIDSKKALEILDKILHFLFEKVYLRETKQPPEDYLDEFHFHRIWYRLNKTEKNAPLFKDIINAKKSELNGKMLINIPPLISYLENNMNTKNQLTPDFVSKFIHSDLHFENILVNLDNEDFILVDPRGYKECDYYYDLGKLYHCVNGMYDFIHENRFSLDWKLEDDTIIATLEIPDSGTVQEYHKIKSGISKLFKKYSLNNDYMKRIRFNEAMHFCSLMPFHLKYDNKEEKAIAFYLTGVKLINDFVNNYSEDFIYEDWININTQAEYEKAKRWSKKGE